MLNILIVNNNPHGAYAFYRGSLPLVRLSKQYPNTFALTPAASAELVDTEMLRACDIVFLMRPDTSEELSLVRRAQWLGKRVWVDYDDDFWSIQDYSPVADIYKQSIVIVEAILKEADTVSVSTAALQQRMKAFNTNCFVIPNAHDEVTFPLSRKIKSPNNKVAVWRGSHTHEEDLYEYREEIVELVNKHSDWQWHFMGDRRIFIGKHVRDAQMGGNAYFHQPTALSAYFDVLYRLNPALCFVPLLLDTFNSSKSSIAWMETCYAGAGCVAPDLPEWKKPGISNYRNPQEFLEAADNAVYYLERGYTFFNDKGWAYIKDNLLLSEVNNLRYQMLTNADSKRVAVSIEPNQTVFKVKGNG